MTITWTDDETILTGQVMDQAALYGLLRKVRDLGLPLIAVTQLPSNQSELFNQQLTNRVLPCA
ncbi:MAG: hypothetical protein M5U34_46865 [Chloroflexi bacterium]|nr:hypothetical protein [Chloroflexota bacterium]